LVTSCVNGSIGTVPWNRPTNALTTNNQYAWVALNAQTSQYLVCGGYSFNIPNGSTIRGIVVKVDRASDSAANDVTDAAVRLAKANVLGSTDRSTTNPWTAKTVDIHGSSTDPWGESWTVADLGPGFAAALAVQKQTAGASYAVVDTVTVEVWYTPPAISSTPTRTPTLTATRTLTATSTQTPTATMTPTVTGTVGPTSVTMFPSKCLNNAALGTVGWTNPAGAQAADSAYTYASLNNQSSQLLVCTDYHFNLPPSATVQGIIVNVNRASGSTAGDVRDAAVRLVKGGVATTDRLSGTPWASWASDPHGGSTDLWNTTWTASEINSGAFGSAVAAQKTTPGTSFAAVNSVSITVWYTP
jgi:hypothetical protein